MSAFVNGRVIFAGRGWGPEKNLIAFITWSFELVVYPTPQILDVPTDLNICDDATADGFTVIDLTVKGQLNELAKHLDSVLEI